MPLIKEIVDPAPWRNQQGDTPQQSGGGSSGRTGIPATITNPVESPEPLYRTVVGGREVWTGSKWIPAPEDSGGGSSSGSSGGGGSNRNPLNLPKPEPNPIERIILPPKPEPRPTPINYPVDNNQSTKDQIIPPGEFTGDPTNQRDIDRYNSYIDAYNERVQKERKKYYEEIYNDPKYSGGYSTTESLMGRYTPTNYSDGSGYSVILKPLEKSPSGTATQPSFTQRVQGTIRSATGISIPTPTQAYNYLVGGTDYGTPKSQKPISVSTLVDFVPRQLEIGTRYIFPEKTVTQTISGETRYFASGTSQYDHLTGETLTPTTTLPEQFSQKVTYPTYVSTIPSQVKAGASVGQWFTPWGTLLFYGLAAEGAGKIVSGIATDNRARIGSGLVDIAPLAILKGVQGAIKGGRAIVKSQLPKIEVVSKPKITKPEFQELVFKNVATGKSYSVYAQGYTEIPAVIKITRKPNLSDRLNPFRTSLNRVEPTVEYRSLDTPKKVISYTPKLSEIGKPVIIATVKEGKGFATFNLLRQEGNIVQSIKLGRGYKGRNLVSLFKDGRVISRDTTAVETINTVIGSKGASVSRVNVLSQKASLPGTFRKLTPKQEAELEVTGILSNILDRPADYSKFFREVPKRRIDSMQGTVITSVFSKPGKAIPTKVDIIKPIKTNRDTPFLQDLYKDLKIETQLLPKIVPKPPVNKRPDTIRAELFPDETATARYLENLDKQYSQFRFGYAYGQFGSYREDITQVTPGILTLDIKQVQQPKPTLQEQFKIKELDLELTKELDIQTNIDAIGFSSRERFDTRSGQRIREALDTAQAQEQQSKQMQQQQVKFLQASEFASSFRRPGITKPPKFKLPLITKKSTEKLSLLDKVRQAFDVVVYERGKEKIIAKGLPEGLARKAGVKSVLSSLRASFKLKPRGTTTVEDITFDLPTTFRPSKVEKGRFVQKLTTRFGSRTETKEAQFFRKQKSSKIKWF